MGRCGGAPSKVRPWRWGLGCSLSLAQTGVYSFHRIPIAALSLLLVGVSVTMAQGVKAFPTAEGFGAMRVGGRGGRVIEVTNLDDSGPGSLAAAWKQPDLASACFVSAIR